MVFDRKTYQHQYYVEKGKERLKKWKVQHRDRINVRTKELRQQCKVECLKNYNPKGEAVCSTCGESRIPVLTLSHTDASKKDGGWRGSGIQFYLKLRRLGYPDLPLLTECMNCNVMRDNWGRGL